MGDPSLDELLLYDNRIEADPSSGQSPQPVQLPHFRDGKILNRVSSMPDWGQSVRRSRDQLGEVVTDRRQRLVETLIARCGASDGLCVYGTDIYRVP
jgi:hypothetical protein